MRLSFKILIIWVKPPGTIELKTSFGDLTMEKGIRIVDLLGKEEEYTGKKALVQGWVRTKRDSKAGICFIEINDGSCMKSLQVIAELDREDYSELLKKITTGSAILVEGAVSASPGKGQSIELHAERIHLYGWADPALYPLQKKRHSFEYLRQIAHLRPRTNTIGAAARVRNRLSYAIHQFFQNLGFIISIPLLLPQATVKVREKSFA